MRGITQATIRTHFLEEIGIGNEVEIGLVNGKVVKGQLVRVTLDHAGVKVNNSLVAVRYDAMTTVSGCSY